MARECDVCLGVNVKMVSTKSQIDGGRWSFIECNDCGARVTYRQDGRGQMADYHTRQARAQAHVAFDPLWRHGLMTRDAAYTWLAHSLGLKPEDAHFANFNREQCKLVVDMATDYYKARMAALMRRAAKRKVLAHKAYEREGRKLDRFKR